MTKRATTDAEAFFAGALPDGWFTAPPEITVDGDEILVVGSLNEPEVAADADDTARTTARRARIKRFREDTRERRMAIADDAQRTFGRTVSWGAACGDQRVVFTNLSVPVMTRLRLPERKVLDTLVAAGVARSRSDALAWCARLVGQPEAEWLNA